MSGWVPEIVPDHPGRYRSVENFDFEHMLDEQNARERAKAGLDPIPAELGKKHRAVAS